MEAYRGPDYSCPSCKERLEYERNNPKCRRCGERTLVGEQINQHCPECYTQLEYEKNTRVCDRCDERFPRTTFVKGLCYQCHKRKYGKRPCFSCEKWFEQAELTEADEKPRNFDYPIAYLCNSCVMGCSDCGQSCKKRPSGQCNDCYFTELHRRKKIREEAEAEWIKELK